MRRLASIAIASWLSTVTAPTVPGTERNVFYHRLVKAVASLPGVAAAGGSINPPIVGALMGDMVVSEPGTEPSPDAERISQSNGVTPGWFAAYGMPIIVGRDFDDHDTLATRPVMIVNEAFVRRFLPDRSPIDKPFALTFRMAPVGDYPLGTKTIVGVVADSVYRVIREPLRPTIYLPSHNGTVRCCSRISSSRCARPPALRCCWPTVCPQRLTAMNPDLTLAFRPLAAQVDESLAQDRVIALLSGFFGGLALLLAALGLYGVTSYTVARRRMEIGIRAALGAAPIDIIRLVLLRVALLVGVGVAIGAGLSLWTSRFVAALLYGVQPRDPWTLIGAAVTLATVGVLAGWLPRGGHHGSSQRTCFARVEPGALIVFAPERSSPSRSPSRSAP